jgi:hypothetical protein
LGVTKQSLFKLSTRKFEAAEGALVDVFEQRKNLQILNNDIFKWPDVSKMALVKQWKRFIRTKMKKIIASEGASLTLLGVLFKQKQSWFSKFWYFQSFLTSSDSFFFNLLPHQSTAPFLFGATSGKTIPDTNRSTHIQTKQVLQKKR